MFRTLAYPAALREILWHVYKVRETRDPDDQDDWGAKWLRFGTLVPGAGPVPADSDDDEEWGEWIDEVVQGFARRHKLLDHFVEELKAEVVP
jgi:hypothetical protein